MGYTSHKALADKIGVSWQTVQLWEKEGGTAPKRDRLAQVAAALGTNATWLAHGDTESQADFMFQSADGSMIVGQVKSPSDTPQVEYIFATPEEIHLLTLFRTADPRERSEIMDRLEALKKSIQSPTLVSGNKP